MPIAVGPNGEKLELVNGQWVPLGSAAPSAGGYAPPQPLTIGTPVAPEVKEPPETWAPLSLEETTTMGLSPGKRYTRSSRGEIKAIGDATAEALDPAAQAEIRDEALRKIHLGAGLIKRSKEGWFATGFGAETARKVLGNASTAGGVAADTETLQSAGALQRIMEMSAKTGKNLLTPISNSDFQALSKSVANLDPTQGDEQYQRNVNTVIDIYRRAYVNAGGDPKDIDKAITDAGGATVAKDTTAPGGASAPEGGGGGSGPTGPRMPTEGQQKEFFRILRAEGVDKANAYLKKTAGVELTDPAAVKKGGFAETLDYIGKTPLVQEFNNTVGGLIEGAAALPDMAAKTIGQGLALPFEWAGREDIANSLRNPLQLGDRSREMIPQTPGALGWFNRNVAGPLVGGALAVPGTVMQRGAEAIAGKVPGALAMFGPAPSTVAAAAGRQGIDLLPADVGGETVKGLTSAAAQVPITRGPIVRLARKGAEQLKAATQRAGEGSVLPFDEAGEAVRSSGKEWIKSQTDRAKRLYDRANELSENVKIMPPNAVKVLDDNIAEYQQAGPIGQGMVDALTEVKDTLSQAGGITVTGLRKARTLLRAKAMNDDRLRGSDADRIFGDVLKAATNDMYSALNAAGKGAAASTFLRADRIWRARIEKIDEVLEPIIGKAKSGEDVLKGVLSMMEGGRGGIKRLQGVLDTLPREEKADVVATIIDKAGRATKSAQDETGTVFSSETFLSNWANWPEKAKRAMFGNGELRKNLNDIALITAAKRQTNAIASKSNTPAGIAGNAAGIGYLSYANPTAAAVGVALQYATGRMLASPRFTRWLAKMPRTQAGIDRHLGRLSYIARTSPVIANDLAALEKALSAPITPGLAAEPSGQEDQQSE